MLNFFTTWQIQYYLVIIFRMVLACVLGGFIGYERESTHRPAGFRTHILVCAGAALVMVTSEFIFKNYGDHTNIDPGRLGGQVISGIGFLGAGTIIREGFNVKGLTTAASLWAVSCVGIAAGIGFYEGAVAATILIYITLILLKSMEGRLPGKSNYRRIFIEASNLPGQLGQISDTIGRNGISIKKIEFNNVESEGRVLIRLKLKLPPAYRLERVIDELRTIEGVHKIAED